MHTSDQTTEGIRIQVRSEYVPSRSSPATRQYFFAYHITITNVGDRPARLTSRHWLITNAEGKRQEVRGPGVVGQTPRLEPGQRFEYTSACPLDTPVGSMSGSFQMVRDDGTGFEARVGTFTLAPPHGIN